MDTVEFGGEPGFDGGHGGQVQGSGSEPAGSEYAVISGICCECWKVVPCVIQVPVRDDAVAPRRMRPVCRLCLARMFEALEEYSRDMVTLMVAKAGAGIHDLPSSPSADEVEEEPRDAAHRAMEEAITEGARVEPQDAVQAGLDAGYGDRMVKIKEGYMERAVRNVEDSLRRIENDPDFNSDLAVMQAGQQNVLLTAIHLQGAMLVELVGKGVGDA